MTHGTGNSSNVSVLSHSAGVDTQWSILVHTHVKRLWKHDRTKEQKSDGPETMINNGIYKDWGSDIQLDVLHVWMIVPDLANIFSSSYPDIQYYVTNHMVNVCNMSSFIRVFLWSYTLTDISIRIGSENRSEVMSTTVWVPRNRTVPTLSQTTRWDTSTRTKTTTTCGALHVGCGSRHWCKCRWGQNSQFLTGTTTGIWQKRASQTSSRDSGDDDMSITFAYHDRVYTCRVNWAVSSWAPGYDVLITCLVYVCLPEAQRLNHQNVGWTTCFKIIGSSTCPEARVLTIKTFAPKTVLIDPEYVIW